MKSSFRLFAILAVILLACGLSGIMAEVPPSFENQQFYGKVSWDANTAAPEAVLAEVGTAGTTYTSVIKAGDCTATVCQGTYGYDPDNILRVQGTKGQVITFYVDSTEVKTYVYAPGEATPLDFSLASVPITETAPEETSDEEEVSKTAVKKTANETNQSFVPGACTEEWKCTEWSICANKVETRVCTEVDDCVQKLASGKATSVISVAKPEESRSCALASTTASSSAKKTTTSTKNVPLKETCSDGKKNQNEEDIDCGGVCQPCPSFIPAWGYYLLGAVVLLLLLGVGGYFLLRSLYPRLDQATREELQTIYGLQERRGFAEVQITENLVSKGWKRRLLQRFLKQR